MRSDIYAHCLFKLVVYSALIPKMLVYDSFGKLDFCSQQEMKTL